MDKPMAKVIVAMKPQRKTVVEEFRAAREV